MPNRQPGGIGKERIAEIPVTSALIGLNVLLFLAELGFGGSIGSGTGGTLVADGGLFGPAVDSGEYYRLFTSGFLHAGLMHIGFNMLMLFVLGSMLEPAVGSLKFAALYVATLFCGALGALVLDPNSYTVGASGAIFGLMGAGVLIMYAEGVNPWKSGLGATIALNLVLSLLIPGVSIGGHVGGLIGGLIIGAVIAQTIRSKNSTAIALATCVAVGGIAVVAALAIVAGSSTPTF